MAGPSEDINDIIKSAVQARVEAAVLEAMASGGTMQAIVVAALNQQVETGRYGDKKLPLLTHLAQTTIAELTKKVVAEEVAEYKEQIRDEVRKALGQSIGVISDSLVDGFVASSTGRYPSVEVTFAARQ